MSAAAGPAATLTPAAAPGGPSLHTLVAPLLREPSPLAAPPLPPAVVPAALVQAASRSRNAIALAVASAPTAGLGRQTRTIPREHLKLCSRGHRGAACDSVVPEERQVAVKKSRETNFVTMSAGLFSLFTLKK